MSEGQDVESVNRDLDPDEGEPAVQIAEIVADLEDREPDQLQSTYDCIDHALDHVFQNPPAPEANVEISFDYEGYHITVEQDGTATFVETV